MPKHFWPGENKPAITTLGELRNSVMIYVSLCGHSPQLSLYLMKVFDFFDGEIPVSQHELEQATLAYVIVEAIAGNVVDMLNHRNMPEMATVLQASIAPDRADPVAAKNNLLQAIGVALRRVSDVEPLNYPDIVTADGTIISTGVKREL